MATYVNDLRLKEIATGDESGTWGTSTNTNLELIAEAFSFGTEAITTNADTHTTTIADGSTDPGRSIYLKYTGTLDSACTITIGPNTVSKLWFIENGTSGSQNIIISQGSGANITIPPGDTKAVYSDGAGSGAAMVDAFASLSVVDLKVQDDLTVTDDLIVNGDIDLEGNMDVNGSLETDALSLNGTTVTSTAAEINLLDGSSANTVVNSKAVIYGSSGQVAGTLSTAAQTNITSLGTLASLAVGGSQTDFSPSVTVNNTSSSNGSTGAIRFVTESESTGLIIGKHSSGHGTADLSFINQELNADLAISTNNTERMRIDSAGLVGIGTNNPSQILSLEASDTTVRFMEVKNSAGSMLVGINGSGNAFVSGQTSGKPLIFETNNTERMRIDSSGLVGIGRSPSSSTGSMLQVEGNDGIAMRRPSQTNNFTLRPNASTDGMRFTQEGAGDRMTIDSSGKVGIGTAPSVLFHVNAADGVADNDFVATITNAEATDGRSFGLGINAGSNGSDFALNINTHDAGANLMRLKGSGDCHFPNASAFGIGTDSASHVFHVDASSTSTLVTFHNTNGSSSDCRGLDVETSTTGTTVQRWLNAGGELGRFSATGVLMVGTTAATGPGLIAVKSTATNTGCLGLHNTNSGGSFVRFANAANNAVIGTITNNSDTNTAYNTSSDARLKNVTGKARGLEVISKLNPVAYNWKESGQADEGLIAQEVMKILPNVVSGSEEDMYQMDYSKLVTPLVKAIQEQQEQIDALQSEINTLKGE